MPLLKPHFFTLWMDENGVVQMVNDGNTYPEVADVIKVTISVIN